tara:strand:- start:465 stop:671 length:207 start_codon:yes stop_codon:yes gene_type:complete
MVKINIYGYNIVEFSIKFLFLLILLPLTRWVGFWGRTRQNNNNINRIRHLPFFARLRRLRIFEPEPEP